MLDVAVRRLDGTTAVDLRRRVAPPLPVLPGLSTLLPDGLRRGSTVNISGSVSLLLAVLGAASANGAWCALIGVPRISAEAAAEYGIELCRLAVVPQPGASWATAVGALLDAVDVVVVRPPNRVVPGDVRRLAARARTRDAVLMPFTSTANPWPGADLRLGTGAAQWLGIGSGYGRLRSRQVTVTAEGRGQAARGRAATLRLPAPGGGVDDVTSVAPVVDLPQAMGAAAGRVTAGPIGPTERAG